MEERSDNTHAAYMGDLAELTNIDTAPIYAAAFAEVLKKYGHIAEHDKRLNIVRLTVNGRVYFIENMPQIDNYDNCTKLEINTKYNAVSFIIDDEHMSARYSLNKVSINGFCYRQLSEFTKVTYKGHLHGNLYTSYENAFIKTGSYPFNINSIGRFNQIVDFAQDLDIPPIDMGNDILSADDFTPVKPVAVDIKNEGFKLVAEVYIQSIKNMTVFSHMMFAPGAYSLSYHTDLFKYVADGKLLALLCDAKTKNASLVNSSQIIDLTDGSNYTVTPNQGLYNGLKIYNPDDIKYNLYRQTEEVIVYYFEETYFSTLRSSNEIVELDMRQPNSGAKTKPACPF